MDAGLSLRALAAAAGIDHGHLARIEAGAVEPSFAVLVAIGDVLGADLSIRLYPTTGPRINDRLQAPIIEALFRIAHSRWQRLAEVGVIRPARELIDAVLALRAGGLVVATEVESVIQRLEQDLRWAPGQGRLATVAACLAPRSAAGRSSTRDLAPSRDQIHPDYLRDRAHV